MPTTKTVLVDPSTQISYVAGDLSYRDSEGRTCLISLADCHARWQRVAGPDGGAHFKYVGWRDRPRIILLADPETCFDFSELGTSNAPVGVVGFDALKALLRDAGYATLDLG